MLAEADTNKDGHIDFREVSFPTRPTALPPPFPLPELLQFLTMMSKQVMNIRQIGKKMLAKESSIRHVFKKLDPNYYGYLTVAKCALSSPFLALSLLLLQASPSLGSALCSMTPLSTCTT